MDIIEEPLPGRRVPSGRIVTARSHFIDRIQPACEIIHIPAREGPEALLRLGSGEVRLEPPARRRALPLRRSPGLRKAPRGRWLMDMRAFSPGNWAHYLNDHLTLFFHAARLADRDPDAAQLILPQDCPGHIRAVTDLLGLDHVLSDDIFEGDGVRLRGGPPDVRRSMRVQWARQSGLVERMARAIDTDDTALPARVFLSRQDTRRITNETEVEALLAPLGFEKVYPETLSVAAQIRLFREADEIVAVHGAGLAPLLYCDAGQGPRHLVEILPVGHMTDVFREMAGQVGVDWIGVRGKIKPGYVKDAYDLSQPFLAYSLDDFEVDPASVAQALELLSSAR